MSRVGSGQKKWTSGQPRTPINFVLDSMPAVSEPDRLYRLVCPSFCHVILKLGIEELTVSHRTGLFFHCSNSSLTECLLHNPCDQTDHLQYNTMQYNVGI